LLLENRSDDSSSLPDFRSWSAGTAPPGSDAESGPGKLVSIQLIDVWISTTQDCWLMLPPNPVSTGTCCPVISGRLILESDRIGSHWYGHCEVGEIRRWFL
jgi:hypothetical protein